MSYAARKLEASAFDVARSEFAHAVIEGLSAEPKTLPCRYFYDARGSALFEEITRLPEYYPTRTETLILEAHARELVAHMPQGATLVEFGSGSSIKTELLLSTGRFARYLPIDVSPSALQEAATRLRARFPALAVAPLVADFTAPVHLPVVAQSEALVGFFPGSTIGNFEPRAATALLSNMAKLLGRGANLIIGVDLQKDRKRLVAAYDDRAGVTAEFNLNILARMRRELGAELDLRGFAHRARYNEREHRIEMHLESLRQQRIAVAGRTFDLAPGETIHTENSFKYTIEGFSALALESGWKAQHAFTDEERLFGVMLLETS